MAFPRVSIIIPTFNRRDCVIEAVRSVLTQTMPDFELIVVDDGSTDGTAEALRPFQPCLRYIHQCNKGVSAARNRGIIAARGEWIAFLDSDDEWWPEYLETTLSAAEATPGLVAVSSDILIETKEALVSLFRLRGLPAFPNQPMVVPRPLSAITRINCSPSAMLVRRAALVDIGGFDESLAIYEDLDLGLRLALKGGWCWIDLPLAKAMRKTTSGLSSAHAADDSTSPLALAYIYEKCASRVELLDSERKLVRRLLAKQRFLLAAIKLTQNRFALSWVWQSLRTDPGRGAIKCTLLVFLGPSLYRWLEARRPGRSASFRRSQSDVVAK